MSHFSPPQQGLFATYTSSMVGRLSFASRLFPFISRRTMNRSVWVLGHITAGATWRRHSLHRSSSLGRPAHESLACAALFPLGRRGLRGLGPVRLRGLHAVGRPSQAEGGGSPARSTGPATPVDDEAALPRRALPRGMVGDRAAHRQEERPGAADLDPSASLFFLI